LRKQQILKHIIPTAWKSTPLRKQQILKHIIPTAWKS